MEILNYRAHSSGALAGFFDLKIDKWGGFIIRKMKLFNKNGRRWVSFPSEKYEKDGETKYAPYNLFEDQAIMEKFSKEVVRILDDYILTKNQTEPPLPDLEEVPF